MADVRFKINGMDASAPAGSTILEAAQANGVTIPTLCYLKDTNRLGACRMCLVEVKGARIPQHACIATIREGMEIETESPLAQESRRRNLELIAENHHLDCEYCPNYQDCELNALFTKYRVDTRKYGDFAKKPDYDETALHLGRDSSRCIVCRRCVSTCAAQGVNAIAVLGRGIQSKVAAPEGLGASSCVGCGQCAAVCPTGSIFVKNDTHPVWVTLNQGKKPVIAVVSRAVGVALGEKFHEEMGENVTGKLVAFLHRVGVKKVYSVEAMDTAAEKRAQVTAKVKEGSVALSGDCPAFVRYIEHFCPELSPNLVTVPPEMVCAKEARAQYAAETGADPSDITVVSFSSCTAQKLERVRPEYEGVIDAAVTTGELYEMLHYACLSRYTALDVWRKLSPEAFDELAAPKADPDRKIPDVVPGDISGTVFSCETVVDGVPIRVKAVSGLGNAGALLEEVKNGTADFDYLAVRACPGGCVAGGGQPKLPGRVRNFEHPMEKRAAAL